MRKIILIIALLAFPLVCFAQDATTQVTPNYKEVGPRVIKANEIMSNVYHDILKIKDSYEELKDFSKEGLTEDENAFLSIEYGATRKSEAPKKGDIWIRIYFTKYTFQEGLDQFRTNDFYLKDTGLYIRCAVWTEPSLRNKILEIIQKNLPVEK